MLHSRPLLLIAGTSLLAGLSLSAVPSAAAESPAATATNDSVSLAEVLVTARKVEESLQDVPDAVTAFSAAALNVPASGRSVTSPRGFRT